MKKNIFLFLITLGFYFASCSKSSDANSDAITLNKSETTLFSEQTYAIGATSAQKISYTSQDDYIATVAADGMIVAGKVGQTTILLKNPSDSKNFKVTVQAKSNLYPTPFLKFGSSKATIEAQYGKPDSETSGYVSYNTNIAAAPATLYLLDTNSNLVATAVFVKTSSVTELKTYLSERYLFLGDDNGALGFVNALNPDKITMGIVAEVYADDPTYWLVAYIPFSESSVKYGVTDNVRATQLINMARDLVKDMR